MSEVLAESIVELEDGTNWAVTMQTTDEEDEMFEVESQVQQPGESYWRSVDVLGPFESFEEAVEDAKRIFPEHSF